MKRIFFALVMLTILTLAAVGQDSSLPKWVQDWQREIAPQLLRDYASLAEYRQANAALPPPAAGEDRVVFLGDSITAGWDLTKSFPGKPYVNRGIGWQNTAQMLLRFRPDVIRLRPKVVVILGGTNDISGAYGPMSLEDIEANYESMAELARANGIQVVFASVLPVHNYTRASLDMYAMRPPEKIRALNAWLREYCRSNGHVYLDYFSSLVDENGLMKKDFAEDGVHPTASAYAVMVPLAEAAIRQARSALPTK